MSTRRSSLINETATATTNAALWLHRYIRNQSREDTDSRRDLVRKVSEIPVGEIYNRWFERWKKVLQDYGAVCKVAAVMGRMAVGLGSESVLETSITLHHTYGVPYVPGSALKGLAATFARQHLGGDWQPGDSSLSPYNIVFGNIASAGFVTFFDALPFPEVKLLYPDIITVHHQDYYKRAKVPPADWDSPNPVSFLSASGKYLIALAGPSDWVKATFEILAHALRHLGVGAKTSSGYGRLELNLEPGHETKPPGSVHSEARVEGIINQINALKTTEVAGRIKAFYDQWLNLEVSPAQKRRVAETIVAKVREAGREKKTLDKEWYQHLLSELK